MKTQNLLLLSVCLLALSACGQKTEKINLFNGKDLTGWVGVVDPEGGIPASQVYSVQNGHLRIEGNPFGYIRTDREFTDYKVHVEWRWIGQGSNSGIFNRIQLPDKPFPCTVECNLMKNRAGILVLLGGATIDGVEIKGEFPLKPMMAESSELPDGEWNITEVECKGDQIRAWVNGVLQNEATGFSNDKGYIGLQSEGGPIEFRNIYVLVED